jgi:hypothetical protein
VDFPRNYAALCIAALVTGIGDPMAIDRCPQRSKFNISNGLVREGRSPLAIASAKI